jgi:hypothetical protein
LTPADVTNDPDWDALPPLSGRVGAEGPGYVPLAYRDIAHYTGDPGMIGERWPYLRRAVAAQTIEDDGTQTFTGDETFRAAMSSAAGLPLEYAWHDLAWSANSAFLMASAADFLAEAAVAHGEAGDVELFEHRAGMARSALDEVFLQDGGWYAPFVFHTAGSANDADQVATHPFEDVNLKPVWIESHPVSDPVVLTNLRALEDHAGRADGTLRSAAVTTPVDIEALDLSEGVGTAMVPGFYLSNLARVGDPRGHAAFNRLVDYATPSGSFPEYVVHADLTALQFIYDEGGSIGDTPARYRPWEAAINGDAMLDWLIGAEPIDGGLRLRPHHPNELETVRADGIAIGSHLVDLDSALEAGSLVVTVTARSDEPVLLVVDLPFPPESRQVESSGPTEAEHMEQPGGEQWAVFAATTLEPHVAAVFALGFKDAKP